MKIPPKRIGTVMDHIHARGLVSYTLGAFEFLSLLALESGDLYGTIPR
jgi:hypothetical protein